MTRRGACYGNTRPYDRIIDGHDTPEYADAIDTARHICGACPLSATCLLVDNADENWAKAVINARPGIEAAA